MKHIIYSNYFWENDKNSKDAYDYAREYLFEEYAEDEGWETEADVPDDRAVDEVYAQDKINFYDFKIIPS